MVPFDTDVRSHSAAAIASPLERAVAAVVRSVLQIAEADAEAHFFLLGGDSLSAIELLCQLRDVFLVELPLETIFSEAATVRGLATAIEAARRRPEGGAAAGPEPVPREEPFPLGPSQERLWFIDQLQRGQPTYNHALVVELSGSLDEGALERALLQLVERHESLRTAVVGSPPRQVAMAPRIDLVRDEVPACELVRRARDEGRRPFDLTAGALLRASLIATGTDEHALVLVTHFMGADAVSRGVLLRDLAELYRSEVEGGAPRLAALALQFADVGVWQRRCVEDGALDAERAYWRGQFALPPPIAELAADRHRPPLRNHEGDRVAFEVPPEVTGGLRGVARDQGATLFMTLLAAFGTLLHRVGYQTDIVIGSPTAARLTSEVDGVVGCLTNTLALRLDLAGDPTIAELVARVRAACIDAFAHQQLPFDQVIADARPDRSLSHDPLFQVFFGMRPNVALPATFGPLAATVTDVDLGTAKFDLDLQIEDRGQALRGEMEFSVDLFDRATIEHLVDAFVALLGAFTANVNTPLSAAALLAPQREAELVALGVGPVTPQTDDTLVELFERQVECTPDAVAVEHRGETLTYAELHAAADRLASALVARGVEPEVPVALLLDRSPELVVGVLAVLMAGGAYVPLDPAYPLARLALMIEDVRPPIVLSHGRLSELLPPGPHVVLVDAHDYLIEQAPPRPRVAARAENAAYILSTSGSTGRPKGVVLEHRNAVDFVEWGRSSFSSDELARVLFSTSLGFDMSVFEIFVPLSSGGTVVLVENALALLDHANAPEVTLLNTVPSAMTELLRAGPLPPSLRTIVLSGERLSLELARAIHAQPQRRRLVNTYAPTETTTYVTAAEIGEDVDRAPLLGRPRPNSRALVLDQHLRPVPARVPGELYIGGRSVTRGYLNRAELTAERYIDDPFSLDSTERLYRTGDLVRWTNDGALEFLGRLDDQVKIRGHRVELGEIDAALESHRDVVDAITVVPRYSEFAGRRLDAYVTTGSSVVTADELRRHLRTTLPEYMLPSTFTFLDVLPRTPNGKVDRAALPHPADRSEETAYRDPRTSIEEAVASIFANVLGLVSVGVDDEFFDLGGHSLLAVQLLVEIADVFGVELPLRSMLDHATPALLADAIRIQLSPDAAPPFTFMTRAGHGDPLFCVLVYLRNVPQFRRLARRLPGERPVFSVLAQRIAESRPPALLVEEMAALAVDRLRAVQPRGPYTIAGYSLSAVVAFEVAQQLTALGEEVRQLVLIDAVLEPPRYRSWRRRIAELLHVAPRRGATVETSGAAAQQLWTLDAANRSARQRYEPRPWHGDAILLVTPDRDLSAFGHALGWERVIRGRLQVEAIPGHHDAVLDEPHVGHVAAILGRLLDDDH